MTAARSIVGFGKDWEDVPTCATHVLRKMGETLPVLWINSIGTRTPDITSGRDLARMGRRLKSAFSRAEWKENHLRVLSPLLVPEAQAGLARWVNRKLFRRALARESEQIGGPLEYWCFVPNAVDLLPSSFHVAPPSAGQVATWRPSRRRGKSRVSTSPRLPRGKWPLGDQVADVASFKTIYYCVDDWAEFHNLDGAWLGRKEAELLERADIVFTASRYLEEKCRRVAGDKVRHMPHGVQYDLFADVLNDSRAVPDETSGLSKPVIGFYGNICQWIDFGLLEALARERPQWSFVMIGQIYCDISRFESLSNVRFLGRREHDVLPGYCAGFDAAIIPYDMANPRMKSVNPVKTKELLAAGVPIVAADIPELRPRKTEDGRRMADDGRRMADGGGTAEESGDRERKDRDMARDVMICRGVEEWLIALERQIRRRDRREISRRVADDDWSVRVVEMRRIVDATH